MYRVEITSRFDKEFKKLDKYTQKMIASWIDKNLEGCENPRVHGKGGQQTGADNGDTG